jgi:phosphoserine phosphatase
MSQTDAQPEVFTGLILLTGIDRPGVAASLFETLAPFALRIIDVEQIVIHKRLILTVLITANPAHQEAIEEDLQNCAVVHDVDIATLFSKGRLAEIPTEIIEIKVSSSKLIPSELSVLTRAITSTGGNIEKIERILDDPTTLIFRVLTENKSQIVNSLNSLKFDTDAAITVNTR